MLCTDVIVTETDSFFLRECEHLLGPFRKSSKHHISCTSMVLDISGTILIKGSAVVIFVVMPFCDHMPRIISLYKSRFNADVKPKSILW
ncbi:hypothetical protein D1872_278120 [compost metagenome]